jgi:tRNA(Ile)-lysidine synthase
VAVALSGGADSTALLHACAQRWPGDVRAIHVHHGLQTAADSFETACSQLCEHLRVPLRVVRVQARHAPGESPEDAARNARYAALQSAATEDGFARSIALAQHADDQVETVLLALSRGAGLAGLAGMRPHWTREGIHYSRPLLDVSAQDIRSWLLARNMAWVEDPTNADERYTRNRIRARLLPVVAEAFPQYRDTFARSARHAAQAQSLLEELARQDLESIGVPPAIDPLRSLSSARSANVLRHWLRALHDTAPSAAQLDELTSQISACSTRGHQIELKVGSGFVIRDGPRLRFVRGHRACR